MRTTGLCVKPGANGTDAGAWGVAGGPTEPTGTDVLSEQVAESGRRPSGAAS